LLARTAAAVGVGVLLVAETDLQSTTSASSPSGCSSSLETWSLLCQSVEPGFLLDPLPVPLPAVAPDAASFFCGARSSFSFFGGLGFFDCGLPCSPDSEGCVCEDMNPRESLVELVGVASADAPSPVLPVLSCGSRSGSREATRS
jgi:hypothetical protein